MKSATSFIPGYLKLHHAGQLDERVKAAVERLSHCDLCAQNCRVDRRAGELGICRTADSAIVSSYGPHYGEEAVLVGSRGSGTIFFANCNLACVFCQNYDISAYGVGHSVSKVELAAVMLRLQKRGCPNINLVSPSHVAAQILEALPIAAHGGLQIPLVYNSAGDDSLTTLKLLDGIVDIYMPDFKFADDKTGEELAGVPNYFTQAKAALQEMHRQVGDLIVDSSGLAQKGLLLRHLVMPGFLEDTYTVLKFVADEISRDTYINVMGQYQPAHRAHGHPKLGRPLSHQEYRKALKMAQAVGLHRFAR